MTTGGETDRPLFTYLQYTLKLVAVKTIVYGPEGRYRKETVSFEYGGLQVKYSLRKPDGTRGDTSIAGWNRVKNISDTGDELIR